MRIIKKQFQVRSVTYDDVRKILEATDFVKTTGYPLYIPKPNPFMRMERKWEYRKKSY